MNAAGVADALAQAGAEVSAQEAQRLAAYLGLVLEESTRQNLTALRTEELFLGGIVDAALSFAAAGRLSGELVDVGSGSGLPAIPWLLLGGFRHATLIEAERRKREFLERAIQALALPAEAVWGRAEEIARGPLRESADVVTAQAVASAPIVLELCAGFCRVGGLVALPKGPNVAAEAREALRVAHRMGVQPLPARTYTVPHSGDRVLLCYRKVQPTPGDRPAAFARLKREFGQGAGKGLERDDRGRSE